MIKLLVIEDDASIRFGLQKALEKHGYQIEMVENGSEALTCFKRFKPDGVITDIIMPGKAGIEVIAELRAIDKDIPIIAMSGGGRTKNFEFLDLAQELGANATLTKPFRIKDIISTLNDVFSR